MRLENGLSVIGVKLLGKSATVELEGVSDIFWITRSNKVRKTALIRRLKISLDIAISLLIKIQLTTKMP